MEINRMKSKKAYTFNQSSSNSILLNNLSAKNKIKILERKNFLLSQAIQLLSAENKTLKKELEELKNGKSAG